MTVRQIVLCCAVALPAVGLATLGLAVQPVGPQAESVLHSYQDLIAGALALSGAIIGACYLQRQTSLVERREQARLAREHLASRAVLPLMLHDLVSYAMEVVTVLRPAIAHERAAIEAEREGITTDPLAVVAPKLPISIVPALSKFIETADDLEAEPVYALLVDLQIQLARLTPPPPDDTLVGSTSQMRLRELNERLFDAVYIYTAASNLFDYARRRQNTVAEHPTWADFHRAMIVLGLHDASGAYADLHSFLGRAERHHASPRISAPRRD